MQTVAKYRRTIDAAGSSGGVSSIAFSTSPPGVQGNLVPTTSKQQQHLVAPIGEPICGGGAAVNVPEGIPSGNPEGACPPAPPQDDLHEICEWDPGG